MFKVLSIIGFSLLTVTSYAGDSELVLVMKSMGSQFKVISSQALDEKQAAQTADLVSAFRKTILEGITMHPDKESKITDPIELRAFNVQFQSMLLKLADDTTALELSLVKFNAENVQITLDKIKQLKVEGHNIFKN